jgi:hypothetical protein
LRFWSGARRLVSMFGEAAGSTLRETLAVLCTSLHTRPDQGMLIMQEAEKIQWQIDEVLAHSLKAQEEAQKQVEQARASVERAKQGMCKQLLRCLCNVTL